MSIHIFIKTFVLYFFFIPLMAFSNESITPARKACHALIRQGVSAQNIGLYTKSLEYFSQAEILAENAQWPQELFDIRNFIGVTYSNLLNYKEARGYYFQALKIANKNPKDNLVMVLNNIANSYSNEEDYVNALKYFKRAFHDPRSKKSDDSKTYLAINISDTYNKMGKFSQARKYLINVEKLPRSNVIDEMWKLNYAETFYLEGKINQAEQIMLKVFDATKINKNSESYSYITELLSKIYYKKNDLDKAILFAEKGLQKSYKMKFRIDLYYRISNLYFKKGDFLAAAKYKDSVISMKDSVSAIANTELLETNKIKLKILKYQNQLRINKSKHIMERNLFIIALLFSVLLFFFIYRILKNNILKQKQGKIIAENEQKIVILELKNLENTIAEKNRKLSAKSLYLSGRNELIEELINSICQISDIAQNKEVSNHIKSLRSYLKTDAEWDDFIAYFEKVNPAFLSILKTKHPQLNPSDIRFICYIYMNLDLKEICNIFSITLEAAKKRKQRIAKKIEIDAEELHAYILQFS